MWLQTDVIQRPSQPTLSGDLLLSDVEHSIADVVCRCLPVSVNKAAAPTILTHWNSVTFKHSYAQTTELTIQFHFQGSSVWCTVYGANNTTTAVRVLYRLYNLQDSERRKCFFWSNKIKANLIQASWSTIFFFHPYSPVLGPRGWSQLREACIQSNTERFLRKAFSRLHQLKLNLQYNNHPTMSKQLEQCLSGQISRWPSVLCSFYVVWIYFTFQVVFPTV